MTPLQQQAHDIAQKLNAAEFDGWFTLASVMAFCQVESAFRPHAYRQEPSGVASYGLMQVLDVTAKDNGLVGSPEQMFDPEVGLRYGMKVAKSYWDFLERHLGRDPHLTEWAASYNEGPGNVMKGREDAAYATPWIAARKFWLNALLP